MITIKIPWKTPSVNHLYFNFKGRRGLTNEATKLRKDIITLIERNFDDAKDLEELSKLQTKKLILTTKINENWYYKNGNVKRADIANREKFLTDSVFKALNLKDEFVFTNIQDKCDNKQEEFAIIIIQEWKGEYEIKDENTETIKEVYICPICKVKHNELEGAVNCCAGQ